MPSNGCVDIGSPSERDTLSATGGQSSIRHQTDYQSAKLIETDCPRVRHEGRTAPARRRLGLPVTAPGKVDMVSLLIIYWITVTSEAARGLFLPSTWPYFASVGGTRALLGVFVGVLSLGRMLTTVPLGYLSDRCSVTQVFHIASILQIVGHLMYIMFPSVWALIVSRFIVGLGSSTISVCRAFVTRSVPPAERTHHFAYLSGLQFIGFAVLPGLGSMLSWLPNASFFGLALNGFTYPAIVLAVCCLLQIALVELLYEDPLPMEMQIISTTSTSSARTNRTEENKPNTSRNNRNSADLLALSACLVANIVFRGMIAELETVSAPFLMEQYGLSFSAAGAYLTVFGVIGLIVYITFKPLARMWSDRLLIVIGFTIALAGTMPLTLAALSRRLPLVIYAICIGSMWSIAYPLGQTGSLSLFSKVMKGLPPGGLLGIFSATGSAARIGFAIAAGAMWAFFGRESVFMSMVICSGLTVILISTCWDRLRE